MKTLTNPEHFSFTNRFGGPHFNKSLLKTRIAMMNRRSTWRSGWRYVALSALIFFTAMCQPLLQSEPNKGPLPKRDKSQRPFIDQMIINRTSYSGDTMIIETYKQGRLVDRIKIKNPNKNASYTWTGDMNQLMEASFFKRKNAMLYIHPDHHLELYDEYRKSVTVFLDGKEVTLDELRKVHIRQVANVHAHKRASKESLYGLTEEFHGDQKPIPKLKVIQTSTRKAGETDYVIWIDRAPNRIKRDSSQYVFSPFYSGDF